MAISIWRVSSRFTLIMLTVCSLTTPAGATNVCGAVCNQTWTATGSPYVMTCDVSVAAGCSLTIDAGVMRIRFPVFLA